MNLELMICPCKQITLGYLVYTVEKGATSFEEVQEITGVGTMCRGCKNKAKAIVENLIEEQSKK